MFARVLEPMLQDISKRVQIGQTTTISLLGGGVIPIRVVRDTGQETIQVGHTTMGAEEPLTEAAEVDSIITTLVVIRLMSQNGTESNG